VRPAAGPLTRRSFVAAAAAASTVVLATPLRAAARRVSAPSLGRSTFAPLVGQTFTLTGPAGAVHATLEELGDVIGAPPAAETRFSLVFGTATPGPGVDGTSTVANRRLGSCSLFLVPVDRGAGRRRHQAIINQL
jgi:hypothetical protein